MSWWFEGSDLLVYLDGPTSGWVAVGFNARPELANSRLVLAAVGPGGAVAEEHHARPPEHPRLRALEVRAAAEHGGRTRILVAVPRAPALAGTLALDPGVSCGLTLAASHHDDFAHHSAWRELLELSL